MADTINNTGTPGTEYTWATATNPFWVGSSGPTWSTAWPIGHDSQVGVSLALGEVKNATPSIYPMEAFSIADARTYNILKDMLVSISVAETYVDYIGFNRNISESISVSSLTANNYVMQKASSFSIAEHRKADIGFNELVSITLLESLTRQIDFIRAYAESIITNSTPSKLVTQELAENLQLIDRLLRKASSVFSEISLFNSGMSLAEFKALVASGSPAGWKEFHKFLPGDYTYQYAKVRAVLETLSDDTPILDNLKVIIDVPDIHNKGTAVITDAAAGLAVTYSRAYNVSNPDIVVAFKGGVGGVASPEIYSETLTGFTVKLINSSGTYITGSVTWASDGY